MSEKYLSLDFIDCVYTLFAIFALTVRKSSRAESGGGGNLGETLVYLHPLRHSFLSHVSFWLHWFSSIRYYFREVLAIPITPTFIQRLPLVLNWFLGERSFHPNHKADLDITQLIRLFSAPLSPDKIHDEGQG
ncbi:hypothetical protein CEXT_708611 [Caerostris extrusa]|uniref:Uncharacterized protein n=1 Tax=Caerostris extrusa TaxID=172846 RepID=A0AAV4Q0S0_CAEEX|nr:hypothetical protein CEXT_708611 [Caerostris extrusa]